MTIARLVTDIRDEALRRKEIRLLLADGEEAGIVLFETAFQRAKDEGFDLVEIAANAVPPVVRMMNWGKFVYEKNKREKESRKKQKAHEIKEIKFHVNIALHDYETKLTHMREFLEKGHRIKVTLQYRNREMSHAELGNELLGRICNDLTDTSHVEATPKTMGRSVSLMLAPGAKKRQDA